jgi:hypothetical protein
MMMVMALMMVMVTEMCCTEISSVLRCVCVCVCVCACVYMCMRGADVSVRHS